MAAALEPHWGALAPAELSDALVALAALRYQPGARSAAALTAAVKRLWGTTEEAGPASLGVSADQLVALSWALKVLGIPVEGLVEALQQQAAWRAKRAEDTATVTQERSVALADALQGEVALLAGWAGQGSCGGRAC